VVASLDAAGDGDPVPRLVAHADGPHRTDPQMRRAVMWCASGRRHGAGARHREVCREPRERRDLTRLGAVRLFVATRRCPLRAGGARPGSRSNTQRFSDTELEDEVVRLVAVYLSPAGGLVACSTAATANALIWARPGIIG